MFSMYFLSLLFLLFFTHPFFVAPPPCLTTTTFAAFGMWPYCFDIVFAPVQ